MLPYVVEGSISFDTNATPPESEVPIMQISPNRYMLTAELWLNPFNLDNKPVKELDTLHSNGLVERDLRNGLVMDVEIHR